MFMYYSLIHVVS
jgi:hypothetical protein